MMASTWIRTGGAMLLGAIVGLALSWLVVAASDQIYTARAEVRVIVDEPSGHEDDAVRSALTQAQLLANSAVSPTQLEAIGQLVDPPSSADELVGAITARTEPGTLMIAISARASSADRAAELAKAAADHLVARSPADATGGIRLELVSPAALPIAPSFPHGSRDLVIGTIAGAGLAGAAALWLLERRRRSGTPRAGVKALPVERRAIAIGVGAGVTILGAMALNLPSVLIQALALLGLVVAAASPAAGLAMLAVLLPMREPPGFTPLGYQPLLISATAFGLALNSLATRTIRRPSALAILALACVGVSAVGAIPELNGVSSEGTVQAIARLMQVAPGILLLAVAWAYFTTHDPVPHLVVLVLAAAAAGVLGIMQYAATEISQLPLVALVIQPVDANSVERATGPFYNPNYYGFFCSLALTLTIFMILGVRRHRLLLTLAAIPIALAMVLAFSRGALLAAGVALLAMVWARSWRAGLALSVAVVVAGFALYPVLLAVRSGLPIGAGFVDVGDASDSERFAAVLSGIPVWLNEPVFGVGFGQFAFESAWFVGNSPATSSHNEFVNILAEQGIVGVVLWGLLVVGFATRVLHVQRSARALAVALLVALIVGSLSLEPLASLQTVGLAWIALAAGAAGPLVLPRSVTEREPSLGRAHPAAAMPEVGAAARQRA
jgi:capsular polysaccharide biosynthesis protein/O-antigen ligase